MIQRFLDSAKQLDSYFLQQLLVLAAHKPEQVLKEVRVVFGSLPEETDPKDLAFVCKKLLVGLCKAGNRAIFFCRINISMTYFQAF